MTDYLLANPAPARHAALAAIFDPATFAHLAAVGVEPGWRCWEVGAGGGSVVRWLVERVGKPGRVLATDLDVSQILAPGAELRVHDVGRDPPPDERFDLVHARLVLVHVAERDAALRAMASVLRPGGWLVVEDADPELQPRACLEAVTLEHQLANRLRVQVRTLLAARGGDLGFGRTLPRRLRALGLGRVTADAYFAIASPAVVALERATIVQVQTRLVDHGLASVDEIERHLANLDAGRIDPATSPLVSAWGQANR